MNEISQARLLTLSLKEAGINMEIVREKAKDTYPAQFHHDEIDS